MMKKITLLLIMLTVSFGYSQNLVTNGDFETGTAAPWYNNAANVVDQGGNFVNQADIMTAGNPWDVNLSQDVNLDNGKTYELSFDAFTDSTKGTRTLVVGIGQNAPNWANLVETVNLTDVSQNFVYQFTVNYGDGIGDRVIFDMGADTGFVFLDNVSLVEVVNTCANGIQDGDETGVDCGGSCAPCATPPVTAAPTPPNRTPADVVSVYSDVYSGNIAYDNFDAGWCGGASVTGIMISGNNTLQKNTGIDCQGINFETDRQNLTDFTHIHFDFYTNDTDLAGDVFNVKLVDFAGGGGEASALEVNINGGTMPQLVANTWVSVDVDITSLGGVVAGSLTRGDIAQIGITTANVSNVWYDNIYFHKNTTLSIDDNEIASFKAYPNPTQDKWMVTSNNNKITSIQVYDVLGKQVLQLAPNTSEATIDGSGLKTGLYFAQIKTDTGSSSIKLVKN